MHGEGREKNLASGDSDQICGQGEDERCTEEGGNGCIWRSVNEAEMQRDGETETGLESGKNIKPCRQRGRTNVNFQLFYEKRSEHEYINVCLSCAYVRMAKRDHLRDIIDVS